MDGFLSHHINGFIVLNIKENKYKSKRKDLILFHFYLQLMKKAGLNLSVFLSVYSSKYVSIQNKLRIIQLCVTLTSTKHVSFIF